MTTQTTQELDELVAAALPNHLLHNPPSDPRELFDLMVRYDVWPVANTTLQYFFVSIPSVPREPYIDHASKLEAATRVILRGVLARIEGEKK